MTDVGRINARWQALADEGLVIQLSDGQCRLVDPLCWDWIPTRTGDVLPEGAPPPGAHLVSRTVGTTLLWKSAGRYRAWRSSATVHEYRPERAAPAPELAQVPRYGR